ncbi:MAG: hypothetical protein CVU56_02055 [Deltaproteobacteria bacterium HGW-Deltaproteobacteria-14]|jgi:hypothetical protein|nr:MAG: hypothetical protein CVU56_02055 [Deltaproteobacteria bacterium HGW-Deltaproteobacteria-14]
MNCTVTCLGLALLVTAASCDAPLSTERTRSYADFGTEAYGILHEEYLWSSTAAVGAQRAAVVEVRKGDLVDALNALITGPVKDGILPVFERLLPLYDDQPDGSAGPLPQMTRDLADILDVMLSDERTVAAVAALDNAFGANPDAVERLLGTLARHPIQLLDRLIAMTLDLEPQLTELFRYLHRELPTLEDGYLRTSTEKGLLQRLLEVKVENAEEPMGPIVFSARIDGRGAPVVRAAAGAPPAPFVDGDGDGQVDVDEAGRPIDDLGVAVNMPTFSGRGTAGEERDQLGRAIVDGSFVYDYFELRNTALAYLVRDTRTLLAQGVHFDLFTSFEALLGGRVSRDDADGQYTGFYVEDAPLLDLLHVVNELRRYPRLVPLIRALEQGVIAKEQLFRSLVLDLAKARDIFQPAPSLTPGNTLFEDLHPTLASLAKHGLFRSLIAAAKTPENQGMFASLSKQMSYTRLSLPSDMALLETPAQASNLQLLDATPWDRADTTDADRSWLQKSCYLMWDTQGAEAHLKLFDRVDAYDVVITDDMANLYVDSIANRAVIDLGNTILNSLAVQLVAEFDDLTPTAEQLNLYMNHDQSTTGNPTCRRGLQVRQHYGPALLALQASGSLRALRPWVNDIVAAGRGTDFVSLFSTLAIHYSETRFTDNGFTSVGTGFRKLEPYLVQLFEQTGFPTHFIEFSAWADQATFVLDGQTLNVADELDGFLRWMLDTDAQVPLRDGTTSIPSKHGGTIDHPSRLQLVVDAFDRIDRALDASPGARAAWDRVDLLGVFLDLDGDGQLINRHALDITVALVPTIADQLAEVVSRPDWQEGIASFDQDLADIMGSRGFTAATDAMAKIRDTPAHRALVDELLAAMLAEQPPSADADLFGANLQMLSLLSQVRVPMDATTQLLRFLGGLLDPDKRYVLNALETLQKIRAQDPDGVTTALAQNLFREVTLGVFPYKTLKQAIKEAQRPVPGANTLYSADDFREVMGDLRDWLRDEHRGAERLFEIIRSR